MMLSDIDAKNSDSNGRSDSGRLLHDIEAISKALYVHKTSQRALVSSSTARSKSVERPRFSESKSNLSQIVFNGSAVHKDKKSSLISHWKKPLKALAHIRHQKFNVCFFLHVHSVEGLPSGLNDFSLSVHWKRKDEVLRTRPSRVLKGIAEFDETLMHQCCVYGSKTGPHHSAKYEAKLFLVYVSLLGAPRTDLGKHWVDLTRLLPLTLEELEGEKCVGKWTTSFKLAGQAMGATLNVSFGFSLVRDALVGSRTETNFSELVNLASGRSLAVNTRSSLGPTNSNRTLRRVGSVPGSLNLCSPRSSESADLKICDDISPNLGSELCKSISFLYQKLNEASFHRLEELNTSVEDMQPLKANCIIDFESGDENDIQFTVIEQGIELPEEESMKSKLGAVQTIDGSEIETINIDEIIEDDDTALNDGGKFHSGDDILDTYDDEPSVNDYKYEDNTVCKNGSTMEDLESAFDSWLTAESAKLESALNVSEFLGQENCMESRSTIKRSHSLDDITESVASDLLNMLGIEHSPFCLSSESDPDSPRERLLREFEKEALASGNFIIDYDGDSKHEEFDPEVSCGADYGDLSDDFNLSVFIPSAAEQQRTGSSSLLERRKAKELEDLETEALMKAWGMNEKAFQVSPHDCSDGFGSPIELLPEESFEQSPCLGDGFGPFIETKDGGFLRSMSPSLFRNSKNVGNLIMQVSHPVVLPLEMGSDIMEILQHLASLGMEKLSLQAKKLMPLEDVTGKTIQQIAQDTASRAAECDRQAPDHESLYRSDLLHGGHAVEGFSSRWCFNELKPSLSNVGTQTDCATLEDVAILAMTKVEAMSIEGLRVQSGMSDEAAPSSIYSVSRGKILASEGNAGDDDDAGGLFSLAVTLEEWSRLDAGIITAEDQISDRTLKILAAHHASRFDAIHNTSERALYWDKASDGKQSLMGNNLTLSLMILLRDPLRNYEPVGSSMLALIQVERTVSDPEINLHGIVSDKDMNGEEDRELIPVEESDSQNNASTRFNITEVHLSGLNTEPGKLQFWGTKTQQQSGTRWLLASGLSKPCNYPVSKSKAIVVSRPQQRKRLQTADILWSISSQAEATEVNWKEAGFVARVRNPDVLFPQ